ncbi:MAG: hypothetical protein J7513_06005 [Solirubrobacteraceae bacterium]|nr:hypothetical protein [Solirubrobacteraceae bacterium]
MDARRTLLADSALRIIGEEGIRALTHHRIDDTAGLSRGSTSYYCRRRVDFLRLALERLYELDAADVATAAASVQGGTSPSSLRRAVAELVASWLSGEARVRSIARIELFMAASHEPELQPLVAEQLAGIGRAGLPFARGRGDTGVQRLAAGLMLMDGLMLAVLREGRPAPSVDDIAALLEVLG